ncbi:MAG: 4-phosphoerythronate dehydrogenase, partial [Bacteroidota bacterium]
MLIVVDDKIPFLQGVLEPYARVVYMPGSKIAPADVLEADALIVRTRTSAGKELLEGSRVKAVVSATIGTDHMDIPWLEDN